MRTQHHASPHTSRWALLLLAFILLAALGLRYRGVAWSHLHPDENTIAQWTVHMEDNSYISDRFYAGGYFQLLRPLIGMREFLASTGKDWRAFQGYADVGAPVPPDRVVFLRKVNVWLAFITVWLIYLLSKRVTGSRGAALAAAGFLALARLHVEHAHYAETDIALVFALTLALYAWARALDGGRVAWFLAAAFLSGWAIGTKFTISLLAVNVLAGAIICGVRGGRPGRIARVTGLIVCGVLLCVAAVVYTNQGMLNWKWFWPQVNSGLSSVYAERAGLLGDSAVNPNAAWISNWDTMLKGLIDTGWIWCFLGAAGILSVFSSSYRRFWPITILFPLLYGWYFICVAPWTRGQEFMTFFPVMAAWIAIGAKELSGRAARVVPQPLARAVAAAVVLAAMAMSTVTACRTASLFGWPDPRVQALRWLQTHAPLDALVGTEKYTAPVDHLFARTVDIDQVEWRTPAELREINMDYLVRNVTSKGRGTLAPHTMKMYPRFEENLRAFEGSAHRLCEWGPVGNPLYMFAGHRTEWWDARPVTPEATFDMPLFRAVCLRDDRAVAVPVTAGSLGSAPGLWVDLRPRRFILNGPAPDSREAYVVIQTAERPADVVLDGLGCRREAALAAYDVAIVPVRRPPHWPRFQEYDLIRIRARPVKHIEYIPCYAEVALTVPEAAMLAYQKGYADRALAFLKEKDACRQPATAWLAYACAVETGDWALADELEPQAREMLDRLEAAREVKPESLLVNGYSGVARRDHCRIRMPFFKGDFVGNSATAVLPLQVELNKNEDKPNGFEFVWRLPARLAQGRYELHFTLVVPRSAASGGPWKMKISDNLNPTEEELVVDSRVPLTVVRKVDVRDETDFAVTLRSMERGGGLEMTGVELRWASGDLLGAERKALAAAVKKHAAHRKSGSAAETPGVVFYPWLKLVSREPDAATGGRRCVFEVLREGAPPLMVKAWNNEKAKRRPSFTSELKTESAAQGARLEVVVPPAQGAEAAGTWMRVEAAVRWSPGALRIEGSDSNLLKIE